jgi:hypothetical protein
MKILFDRDRHVLYVREGGDVRSLGSTMVTVLASGHGSARSADRPATICTGSQCLVAASTMSPNCASPRMDQATGINRSPARRRTRTPPWSAPYS